MMFLRLLILAGLLALAPFAQAQVSAPAASPPAAHSPAVSAPAVSAPGVSADDARHTLEVLQDQKQRDQLISTLRTIAQAQPKPAPSPAAAPIAPVIPGSLGAEVLVGASGFLNHVSGEATAALGAIQSVPLLWAWLHIMATEPWAHDMLLDTAWRLAVVLAVSLALEWALRWAVRRPILTLVHRAPNGGAPIDEDPEARAERGETEPPHRRRLAALLLLRRMPLMLARCLLELLPVLAFLAAGHLLVATSLGGRDPPRLVLLAVIDGYALCAAIIGLARTMFSPRQPRLRMMTMTDGAAAYAMRWTSRIAAVSVLGYAIAEVGSLLGLTDTAHDALLKAVAFVDNVLLAIIVLQQRRAVRQVLRAPEGSAGPFAALRNWLARVWHWLALLLLAGLWLASVIEVRNGYASMLRYFGSIVVVMILARLLQIVVLGGLDRAMSLTPDAAARYPGIDARLALYHPVMASIARGLIFLAAAVLLLQLWGLGAFDWLTVSTPGRRLLTGLLNLAVTVLLAVAVWEAVNAAIERHLVKLAREAQAARSARLRTLLPLLRTTLSITILAVAGMMVLSEIGVNIGPLLAGAGIIGVAIGFGSQTLVRDLITGIFLLLENAMQVGDTVTVAGLTGTVENLSVRIIRLRANDGSVHLIPFSSVTTVTNVNRGLGNASVSVSVAASEDTDRVSAVLKQIASEMRADPDYAARMLSDLQLWGVDKVDGASATIAGQVVCTDSGRWNVQREFNRRMKKRFDELGIRLYNPVERMVAICRGSGEGQP